MDRPFYSINHLKKFADLGLTDFYLVEAHKGCEVLSQSKQQELTAGYTRSARATVITLGERIDTWRIQRKTPDETSPLF